MKNPLIILAVVVAAVIIGAFYISNNDQVNPSPSVTPIESSPVTSLQPTPTNTGQANITVTSPKANAVVTNPITVTGQARVFENTFNYILRDSNGTKLFESYGMTDAPDSGIFGNYTIKLPVPAGASKNLVIEVFEYSAKDGAVINLVRVPVTLQTQATSVYKVYLGSTKLPGIECEKVAAVNRTVIRTGEPAYISLVELLKGPTPADKAAGYITSIPSNVRINSITIQNGVARVDFDEALQAQVGGSCRVSAIRAQITETLKQFSTVKSVVISINGRTEDILQP